MTDIANDAPAGKPTLKAAFPAEYGTAYERAKHREATRSEWVAAIRAIMTQVNWPETPTERHPEIVAALASLWPVEAEVIRLPSQRADDLQLIRNGFEPIACVGKAPVAQAWQIGRITPERIVAMREAYPQATNTGLRTGKVVAIDIDIVNPDHVAQIVELAASVFGDTPLQRFGSKGLLLCYRADTPSRKVVVSTDTDAKVEILGQGQQFISDGIHPDTGKPYEWRGLDDFDEIATPLTVPLDTLPAVTPAMIADFADQCAELLGQLGYSNPRVSKVGNIERKTREHGAEEDAPANVSRAKEHLENLVEQGKVAVLGALGNDTIYNLAAVLMDRFYLSEDKAAELMLAIWYPHCQPNHLIDDVRSIVSHAGAYIQNEPGANATGSPSETFKNALADLPKDAPEAESEPNKDGTRYFEGIGFRRMSDIRSEKRKWLWKDRLAMGALGMIAGFPGEGKSTIAFDIAARITRGSVLPEDNMPVAQGAVLIMSGEDHEAQTIKPRLQAAGADMTQVFTIDATVNEKDNLAARLISLGNDLMALGALIEKLRSEGTVVRLIIIDPISAYLGGGDSYNNAKVRGMLTPLSKLAEKHNFAVLLVSHYKKSTTDTNALYKVTDSIAFVAACRTVLLTHREIDSDGKPTGNKFLLNGKMNIIPEGTPGLIYKTEAIKVTLEDGGAEDVPIVKWEGTTDLTPDEAMAASAEGAAEKQEFACVFLAEMLTDHPMTQKDVQERAVKRKISMATLRRAKKHLGIISSKGSFHGDWWWALPSIRTSDARPYEPDATAETDKVPF